MLTQNDLVKTENTFAKVIDTLQNKDDLVEPSFWKTLEAHRKLIENDTLVCENPRIKITFYVYYSISKNKLVTINVAGDSVFRTGIQVDDSTAIGRAMLDQNYDNALELIRKKVLASARKNQAKLNKVLLADDNNRQLASMIKKGLVPVELDEVWTVLKKDYDKNQDLLNAYLTLSIAQKNTKHWNELFPFVLLNGAETNQGKFNLIEYYTMVVNQVGASEVTAKMIDWINRLVKMSNADYNQFSLAGWCYSIRNGLQIFDTVVTNCPELKEHLELFKAFGKVILRNIMKNWNYNQSDKDKFNTFDEFINYIKNNNKTRLTIDYTIVPPMKNDVIAEWIFVEINNTLF